MRILDRHSVIAKIPFALLMLAVLIVGALGTGAAAFAQNSTIFGPNVYVYTPSDSVASINSTLATLAGNAQFSTNRYAVFFMPGTYSGVEAQVGFYESVAGLGVTPTATSITNGYLTANTTDSNGNVTTNFWRSLENMGMTLPSGDTEQWAVSQGADFRRMYINDTLELTNTNCGEASGGFIGDSQITGVVNSCSQQQWFTRNSSIGGWSGNLWNMTFSGVQGAPAAAWGTGGNNYAVLATTPVVREKPFLYVDSNGNYFVFSPSLRTNSTGTDWSNGGLGAGTSLPISTFLIATPSTSLATINSALASGQNLILTPGIYQYSGSINVTNANTVVLGMGYADLVPQSGTAAMTVADVDGVQLAGFLIDAGPVNSPVLLQVGVAGAARASHASNPTSISDVNFRIGGATSGSATIATEIDSDNVIIDNMWSWRADHGADASWTGNVAMNGLVVNGDNVTALGLAVEHYEAAQVQWNGNGGETIFYQSEMPYDVPSQSAWMDGSVDGWASYNVAPTVTTHQAYGLGVYSYFDQGVDIIANSGISAPLATGVKFTDSVSVYLAGSGQINYNLAADNGNTDNAGTTAESGSYISYVSAWGGTGGSCTATPTIPGAPSATGTSSSTMSVTWGTSTAGSSCNITYTLFRSTTPGFTASSSNQIASALTSGSFADSGLAASTTYYYVVEAADGNGTSASSSQGSGTTQAGAAPPPPTCSAVSAAPTGVATGAITTSSIGLSWSAVTAPANCSISSYSVYSSTGTLISGGLTGTSYTVTGLNASTNYSYYVKAVDGFGTSAASATVSGTTSAPASSGGSDVVAINAGGAATGSFSADGDFVGGTTYSVTSTINVSAANAAPAAVYQSEREGATTYTLPGLTAGTSYTVRLHFAELYFSTAGSRVFNVAINGTPVLTNFDVVATAGANDKAVVETFTATANGSGQIVVATSNGTANQPLINGIEVLGSGSAPTAPSAPSGLTATASSSSQINLSWTASSTSGVTYDVYRSTTSGFTAATGNQIAASLTATSYVDTNLSASTQYYYLVEANNSVGNSSASNQATATTQAPAGGGGGSDVIALNSGGAATGSFSADADYSGGGTYSVTNTINVSAANAAPMAVYQSERQGAETYTLPGLTSGTSYTVRLHFAELYFSAAGQREFNVAINGTPVLTNFDIVATAGANDKAVVETFTATANGSGQITVALSNGSADQPMINGIEVVGSGSTQSAPNAPSGLTATATSSSQINLSWTASTTTGVTYQVYRSTTSGFTAATGNQVATGLTGTSYASTGLNASTAYYYLVEANNSVGNSSASNQATATTQAPAGGGGTDLFAINAGGPVSGTFTADEDYIGGGTYSVGSTINVSAANAAPMAVYQTARQGAVTYTLPGLVAGSSHTVRLHFAELYFSAAGQRVFNVSINGTAVLTNFDIVGTAGANDKAVVETFTTTANSSGQIIISLSNGTKDQPMINGIEVQ